MKKENESAQYENTGIFDTFFITIFTGSKSFKSPIGEPLKNAALTPSTILKKNNNKTTFLKKIGIWTFHILSNFGVYFLRLHKDILLWKYL